MDSKLQTKMDETKPEKSPDPQTPTEAAASENQDASAEPQAKSVVNQFLKLLLRKHSSGDLHSRLKTRKLLGVGETDDGDIHRSKLSQILGHSDQLYIRLPYGLRIWQLLMAIMFTVIGLWALVLPSHIFHTTLDTHGGDVVTLPVRLYGGALISLSIVYWMTLSSQDRDVIRMSLLTSIVYFVIQFVVTFGHLVFSSQTVTRNVVILMVFRALFVFIGYFYHWALTQRKFSVGMKRSASNKELNNRDK